jgi:hypothetical protein
MPSGDGEIDGIAEVCTTHGFTEHVRLVSFPVDEPVGQIACLECLGSGWWGWAAYAVTPGPCIACKGTGRVWVGLW